MQEFLLGVGNIADKALVPGTWRALPDAPVTLRDHSVAVIGTRLYVFGGLQNGTISNGLHYLDLTANTWTTVPPGTGIPGARQGCVMQAIGGELYVYSGLNGGTTYNACIRYTPATNAWTARASGAACVSAASAVRQGKMIVYGGISGANPLATTRQYDPVTNIWSNLPTSPRSAYYGAIAVNKQDVYAYGGVGAMQSGNLMLLTSNWSDLGVHLPARNYANAMNNTMMVWHNHLYTFGGALGSPFEAFDLDARVWTDLTTVTQAPPTRLGAQGALTPIGWVVCGGAIAGTKETWLYTPGDWR